MTEEKSNLNFPNFLTVIRILLVPFFIYFLFQEEQKFRIIAFCIFLTASITDFIDGYLARKWNQETEFGKFLDPLADKVLVIGSFVTFILLNEQVEIWMVFLIVLRDMLITFLRYLGIMQGKIVQTTKIAKLKTVFQMGAIAILLTLFMVLTTGQRRNINSLYDSGKDAGQLGIEIANENFQIFFHAIKSKGAENVDLIYHFSAFLPYYVMLLTTLITVLSGIRYIVSNRQLLNYKNILESLKK